MRKFLLLAPLFFLIKVNAQVSKGWYAEVQAMGGHSWYSNSREVRFHPLYKGGLNLIKIWDGPVGFGAGAAFSREGMTNDRVSHTVENLYYIRVPIFARFLVNRTKRTILFADTGTEWGFYLGGKNKSYHKGKVSSTYTPGVNNEQEMGLFGNLGLMHSLNGNLSISGFAGYFHSFSQLHAMLGGSSPMIANRNVRIGIGLAKKL